MSDLKERLRRIVDNWDLIHIRVEVRSKWGAFPLEQLDDKTVATWIRDYILEEYIIG